MLSFSYTGASDFLQEQNDPNQSLGGFISSSIVSNDVLDNLFSSLSNINLEDNLNNYCLLAIKNEDTVNEKTNLRIYWDYQENNISTLEISAVTPSIDSCNRYFFEKISNKNSKPLIASFVEAEGVLNEVVIGNLQPNQYIGIWFNRKIKEEFSDNVYTNTQEYCDELILADENNTKVSLKEKIELFINYD